MLRKVAEDITPEYPSLKELILNMYETAGYFFMFLGKQSALLIPKRCLSDEDLADFREMLQFQLGSRYENRTQKSKKAK